MKQAKSRIGAAACQFELNVVRVAADEVGDEVGLVTGTDNLRHFP
jgi:hypothetical protein